MELGCWIFVLSEVEAPREMSFDFAQDEQTSVNIAKRPNKA